MRLASVAAGGTSLVAILACGGLATDLTPTPADHAVAFTAADLATSHGVAHDPQHDQWSLQRDFDGAVTLEYSYEALEGEAPLFVNTVVSRDPTADDARYTYGGLKVGLAVGFAGETDLNRQPQDDLLTAGDAHHCEQLVRDGEPVGTVCVARQDAVCLLVVMVGAVWTEPDEATRALAPKLAAAATWDPAQRD